MTQDQPSGMPLAFQERIPISEQQLEHIQRILSNLSQGLDSLPVVLSQDSEVIGSAGRADEALAARIARLAARIWREGASRPAREFICFEEEVIDEADERISLLLYSVHITGAVTLTIGWQMSITLTQLRAEAAEARAALRNVLAAHE
ncbi:MAG TPA: hypothetical protein ENI95_09830 [Chloroflexi bacterium]|nr:hypothetical protein [Chloroflexota bacterium]